MSGELPGKEIADVSDTESTDTVVSIAMAGQKEREVVPRESVTTPSMPLHRIEKLRRDGRNWQAWSTQIRDVAGLGKWQVLLESPPLAGEEELSEDMARSLRLVMMPDLQVDYVDAKSVHTIYADLVRRFAPKDLVRAANAVEDFAVMQQREGETLDDWSSRLRQAQRAAVLLGGRVDDHDVKRKFLYRTLQVYRQERTPLLAWIEDDSKDLTDCVTALQRLESQLLYGRDGSAPALLAAGDDASHPSWQRQIAALEQRFTEQFAALGVQPGQRVRRPFSGTCFRCGVVGHRHFECPQPAPAPGRGQQQPPGAPGPIKCSHCGSDKHVEIGRAHV